MLDLRSRDPVPIFFGAASPLKVVPFEISLSPPDAGSGPLCAGEDHSGAIILFSFGQATASHRVSDLWTACCELYLQAQLAKRGSLHSLELNGVQLFEVVNVDDAMLCIWSSEHIFATDPSVVVRSFETLVGDILARVPHSRRREFVRLGAALIQERPRFAPLIDS